MIDEHMIQCTGCGACLAGCPRKCISMIEDVEGFLYPKIDKSTCISCNLCAKVCPALKENIINTYEKKYFGLINKNEYQIKSSTSGGFFIAAASLILSRGGYIAGCVIKDNCAIHIVTNREEDVKKMQGSKYVQSNIGGIHSEIKALLDGGKKVLFTGTPCQTSGLISYLGKPYDNLLCVDIICHGVPSQKFLTACVDFYEKKFKAKIVDISFRKKLHGIKWGKNYGLSLVAENKKQRYIKAKNDVYYRCFLSALSYRESCYQCSYSLSKSASDITIGDFWGGKAFYPNVKADNGLSIIRVNTPKGSAFFDEIGDCVETFQTTFDVAVKENPNLITPSRRDRERSLVYKELNDFGYAFLQRKMIKKYFIKNLIPNDIKEKIKRLLSR